MLRLSWTSPLKRATSGDFRYLRLRLLVALRNNRRHGCIICELKFNSLEKPKCYRRRCCWPDGIRGLLGRPPLFDKRDIQTRRRKIHVLEGQYDEARLGKVSKAVQEALMSALGVPPDDFFQIIHILPRSQFRHTPSFLGLEYSDGCWRSPSSPVVRKRNDWDC